MQECAWSGLLKIAILFMLGIMRWNPNSVQQLETEAPLYVDIIQDTIGNHEKKAVPF